jgi:uncharacterized damage-inducible protein DinB
VEIRHIDSFLPYYGNIRRRTLRVSDCIPAERFDWTYRDGKFTLADLLRHIGAAERYMFAENVQDRPSRYPGHGRQLADGPEEVRSFLDRMHAESLEIFGRLTDSDLQRKCTTPAGIPITAWKWLRAMVEHEIHHRGQIYLYLGMLGVPTPPLYGLTSEEVYEKSLHEPN